MSSRLIVSANHVAVFYHVVRCDGVSNAAKSLKKSQATISYSLTELEFALGKSLRRKGRRFALTEAGQRLYDLAKPFFERLDSVTREIHKGFEEAIRVGASEVVLRDYFPDLLIDLRQKFRHVKFGLREGYQPQLLQWLHDREIDIAITVCETVPPPDFENERLLGLPLVLLCPDSGAWRNVHSAEVLIEPGRRKSLVSLRSQGEPICEAFQKGLLSKSFPQWSIDVEVSSVQLIERYVLKGAGVGLSVLLPAQPPPEGIRVLKLDANQFKPVNLFAIWQKGQTDRNEAMQTLLSKIREKANELTP